MEITWRLLVGSERGKNGGKGTGNKKHKWYIQNRQEEIKNSVGNGEAKELKYTNHGHELRGSECWRERSAGRRGKKGRKNGTTVIA